MMTLLRSFLILCAVVGGLAVAPAHAASVTQILGASVICDPNVDTCQYFPTQGIFLCNGTGAILDCPQFFAPDFADTTGLRFFGLTNRTNPPRCVQSTDGGIVWGLCPSNPFGAAIDILGAAFTVASNGSLLTAAQDAPDNCIIRRSTDYGISWATVYTDATAGVSCGIGFGTPTPNIITCDQTGGYCAVIARDAAFALWAVYSTDNGLNWTKGVSFSIVNGNTTVFVKSLGGSRGALTRGGINYGGAQPVGERIVSDWDNTGATPAPGGAIGTASNGATATVFDGIETIIAGPTSNPSTTHYRYSILGGVPLEVASFIPAGAPAFVNGPVLMAHGFGSIGYFISRSLVGGFVNLYMTLDGFDNVSLTQQLTPATAIIAGCCTGDMHTWNSRIYFASGGSGSNAFLVRIQ